MNAWRYVLRGLRTNKRRYALGASSIIISTMIMITIGVVFAGGQNEFRSFFDRAYAYDLEIHQIQVGFNTTYFDIDEVSKNLSGIDGIESVNPILGSVLYGNSTGNSTGRAMLVYGARSSYTAGRTVSLEGKYDLSQGNAILSKSMAAKLSAKVGDTVNFRTLFSIPPKTFSANVSGIVELEGRFSPGVVEYVIVDIDYLGSQLNLSGKATTLFVLVDQNLYDLQNTVDPVANVFALGERVALKLGTDFEVTAMKGFLVRESMQGTSFFGIMLYVFSGFFPAISGVMVSSILNLSVEDRAHDLAILRLMGSRRRSIGRIILVELGLIMVLGLPIGVAMGLILPFTFASAQLSSANPMNIATTISIQIFITISVLMVFAIRPLMKALRSDPIEAVRRTRFLGQLTFQQSSGIDRRIPVSGMLLFLALAYSTMVIPYILLFSTGTEIVSYILISIMTMLVCLCTALLVFAGQLERALVAILQPATSKTNKLARSNISRYSRRNLSTNVIFGVVVAILIFFTSLLSTVRGSIEDTARFESGADIRVRSAFDIPDSRFDGVIAVPGIQTGAGVGPKIGAQLSNLVGPSGDNSGLYAADARLPGAAYLSDEDYYYGGPDTFNLANDTIIISRSMSTSLNVRGGDTIRVDEGERHSFLKITAILNTFPGFPFEITQTGGISRNQASFISFEQYHYLKNETGLTNRYSDLFLKVSSGSDPEKVAELVKAIVSDTEGVRISVTKTNVKQVMEVTSFLDVIFSAVLLGMMMVAVFSLMSNLYASIKEREFEIGVLRAVGMRRSQVLQSLMLEGVAVAVGAVLLGFITGLIVSYIMVWFIGILSALGWSFVLPWDIMGLVLAVTLITSIIGVMITSRSVTKKEVITLIKRTE